MQGGRCKAPIELQHDRTDVARLQATNNSVEKRRNELRPNPTPSPEVDQVGSQGCTSMRFSLGFDTSSVQPHLRPRTSKGGHAPVLCISETKCTAHPSWLLGYTCGVNAHGFR